jgi:hypothetical protein
MTEVLRLAPLSLSLRNLRRATWVLLTALVLVQTVGVLHRVAHVHTHANTNTPPTNTTLVAAEAATAATSAPDFMGAFQRLWGEHSNSVDCQLFDQSCPDALHVTALVMIPALPAARWMAATLQERFALVERFYAARGPPVLH